MLPSTKPDDRLVISLKEARNLSGQTQKNQNNQTDTPKLTPLQQRKRDALDMAELIYNIYNSNCPISLDEKTERNE